MAAFYHLFHSKRLVFRAMENNDEHIAFIRDMMVDDPETYAQSTERLLSPLAYDEVENDIAGLVKSLLAVIICLRPESVDKYLLEHPDVDDDEGSAASEEAESEHENECRDKKELPSRRPSQPRRLRQHHRAGHDADHRLTAIGWLTLDCHALALHHRSCTLGIMLGSAHQGRGYGTEAINWALDWAFRVAGMHAVRLSCFSFNERAARLYQRLGFVREGVARDAYFFDCKWYNRVLFSILDREWAAKRGLGASGSS